MIKRIIVALFFIFSLTACSFFKREQPEKTKIHGKQEQDYVDPYLDEESITFSFYIMDDGTNL